ncbi:hypothetical protein C8R45DRAFT_1208638, partial [Mycena sanguinolenta]
MAPTRTSGERTKRYDVRAPSRSELPMAKKLVTHDKPCFDINASLSKDKPLVVVFFTAAELAKLNACNILGNLPCTKCCLGVATWGFGAYIYDSSLLSACARPATHMNTPILKKTKMRSSSFSCEQEIVSTRPNAPVPRDLRHARSLSQVVNSIKVFPAMVLAPPGVRKMHRPAKRQELREHVEAIVAHYNDTITRSEHRLTFASANWDRRDRLDRLENLDQLDLEDHKRKWNAYETARLAVQSAEAAAERANDLANELSTLGHSAPMDSLREK